MNMKLRKLLTIVWLLSVLTSGIVYAATGLPINVFTDVATSWSTLTSTWVNNVNATLSTVSAAGTWPTCYSIKTSWQCKNKIITYWIPDSVVKMNANGRVRAFNNPVDLTCWNWDDTVTWISPYASGNDYLFADSYNYVEYTTTSGTVITDNLKDLSPATFCYK